MFHHLNNKLNTITDYLSFGIKALDLHNEKFYKLLEELRIYSTTKEKKSVIKEILDEFEAYSNYHFTVEENMMHACNFPDLETHITYSGVYPFTFSGDIRSLFVQKLFGRCKINTFF